MNKNYSLLIALFLTIFTSQINSQNIVINEILASNSTINADEDGSYEDWVEIFNKGTVSESLAGYGLTDDVNLLYKWVFPDITLAPGEYKLIWCSNKNRTNPANPLHTNFKLTTGTDSVTLTNVAGATVDYVPASVASSDVSYGRLPNGTGPFVYFNAVTPAAANGAVGYNTILSAPVFSQSSGFYNADLSLTLSSTEPGSTIIYTVDGSEPDAANLGGTTYSYKNVYAELASQTTGPLLQNSFQTLTYTSPITIVNRTTQPNKLASMSSTYNHNPLYIPQNQIFKGTVIRAKVIMPGALASKSVTHTYFVTPLGSSVYSLPVASLSLNENSFFDYNSGIFTAGIDFDNWRAAHPMTDADFYNADANFRRIIGDIEKEGNINYFVNGNEVLNQDIGIQINGGASRGFQSKAIRLVAHAAYGDGSMQYHFFADQSLTKYDRLILRNSGNDFNSTMFRDALSQSVAKDLGLESQSYQPTITFVNGEYWGILNLREKYDTHYFKNVYNIASTEIDILSDDLTPAAGDGVNYNNMATFMQSNSLAVQANYDYINTQMDIENIRDYYISNIFLENVDWPGWNTEFWRKRTPSYLPNAAYGHDGRWRTALKDMDSCFGATLNINDHDTLAFATEPNGPPYPNPPYSTLILRSLLTNPDFKINFINRFADLMNSYFMPARVIGICESMKSVIQPEMPEHIARWSAVDYGSWQVAVDKMETFASERPAYQRTHIRQKFAINSNIDALLNVSDANAGYIKMNTINVNSLTPGISSSPYPWTGIYFSNIPVKLKAIAYPGFVFNHWTGASTSTNPEITITSATDFAVTAVFSAETAATSHPIYFWMMNSTIANNVPLLSLNTSYKAGIVDGIIQYQSCLIGYPFTSTSPNWRKASMERRSSPTDINYIPEVNSNLPFATSDMKGLQIKEPLQSNSQENMMVFNIPTSGYKEIKFSFAVMNELTNASNIILEYAVNSGTPIWTSTALMPNTFPLSNAYQLINADLSTITTANNNPDFKMRLRFTGTNMTVDTGARITFNNIAVFGTQLSLGLPEQGFSTFSIYPNPFSSVVNVTGSSKSTSYKLFAIDGKIIKKGIVENHHINFDNLSKGIYLLQLSGEGKIETKKIIKQ